MNIKTIKQATELIPERFQYSKHYWLVDNTIPSYRLDRVIDILYTHKIPFIFEYGNNHISTYGYDEDMNYVRTPSTEFSYKDWFKLQEEYYVNKQLENLL